MIETTFLFYYLREIVSYCLYYEVDQLFLKCLFIFNKPEEKFLCKNFYCKNCGT